MKTKVFVRMTKKNILVEKMKKIHSNSHRCESLLSSQLKKVTKNSVLAKCRPLIELQDPERDLVADIVEELEEKYVLSIHCTNIILKHSSCKLFTFFG